MDDTQYCDCLASRMSRGHHRCNTEKEERKMGRGKKGWNRASDRFHGGRLTDWKQAETFMAAVSRAVINPLSGLFIETTGEREFLICVKIVPRDRV